MSSHPIASDWSRPYKSKTRLSWKLLRLHQRYVKKLKPFNSLVSEGPLDPADLDALVAEGLDKDAVAYWKKYYGQTDGGGEFASELVKEHVKAQLEEQLNTYRVKLARAYELAYDMAERGMCNADRGSISSTSRRNHEV